MSIALDTSGTGIAHGATETPVTISTSGPNEVILLLVQTDVSASAPVTSVSGGGLVWTKYKSVASHPTSFYYQTLDLWWAPASSALTSQTIEASIGGGTFDAMAVSWASFSGVNTSSPFDTNASLPATGTTGNTGQPVSTVS